MKERRSPRARSSGARGKEVDVGGILGEMCRGPVVTKKRSDYCSWYHIGSYANGAP